MTTKAKTKSAATETVADSADGNALISQGYRPVLVCTEARGVFFGYALNTDSDPIKLKRGRCCLYWPSEVRGFIGLASVGPLNGARVGPAADIELRKITCVVECTDAAVTAWESAPWK